MKRQKATTQADRIADLEAALKELHDAACDVPVMRATERQRELVKRCDDAIGSARSILGYPGSSTRIKVQP